MKIDENTLLILKNFASINPSLRLKPGKLKTISPNRSILAESVVDSPFEHDFCVYSLSKFLSTLSMFKNPELEFDKSFLTISSDDSAFRYHYTAPELIVQPTDQKIKKLEPEAEFTMMADVLQRTLRAMSIGELPELAVTARDGKVYLEAIDSKGGVDDRFSIYLGLDSDKNYRMVFKADNIKMLPGDYSVVVAKGLAHFRGPLVEYWVAVESNSTYG